MRLRLSSRAQTDIAGIVEFGVERFGEDRTKDYLDRIDKAFRQLRDYPESGRTDRDLHPRARSLSCGAHRIFYSIDDEAITIRRILHKTAEWKRWLE